MGWLKWPRAYLHGFGGNEGATARHGLGAKGWLTLADPCSKQGVGGAVLISFETGTGTLCSASCHCWCFVPPLWKIGEEL